MENETEFMFCRVSLIMWVTNYIHQAKRDHHSHQLNPQQPQAASVHEDDTDSAHPSLDSSKYQFNTIFINKTFIF